MNPYSYVCDLKAGTQTSAQEAMENSLLSLLEEKELYKISVKELCKKANVARSTFYAYYDDIDDCLLSIENRFLYRIVRMNTEFQNPERIEAIDLSFYDGTLKFIAEKQKMLYLLMNKRYSRRFVSRWKDAIKYHQYDRMPDRIGEKNKELTLEIIACETIGAYQYWLENPYELDVDYAKQLIRRTIEAYTEQ